MKPRAGTMRKAAGFVLGFLVAIGTAAALPATGSRAPRIGDPAPEINGAPWINSPPLALAGLRGKVVLVEFWTYG